MTSFGRTYYLSNIFYLQSDDDEVSVKLAREENGSQKAKTKASCNGGGGEKEKEKKNIERPLLITKQKTSALGKLRKTKPTLVETIPCRCAWKNKEKRELRKREGELLKPLHFLFSN